MCRIPNINCSRKVLGLSLFLEQFHKQFFHLLEITHGYRNRQLQPHDVRRRKPHLRIRRHHPLFVVRGLPSLVPAGRLPLGLPPRAGFRASLRSRADPPVHDGCIRGDDRPHDHLFRPAPSLLRARVQRATEDDPAGVPQGLPEVPAREEVMIVTTSTIGPS